MFIYLNGILRFYFVNPKISTMPYELLIKIRFKDLMFLRQYSNYIGTYEIEKSGSTYRYSFLIVFNCWLLFFSHTITRVIPVTFRLLVAEEDPDLHPGKNYL